MHVASCTAAARQHSHELRRLVEEASRPRGGGLAASPWIGWRSEKEHRTTLFKWWLKSPLRPGAIYMAEDAEQRSS